MLPKHSANPSACQPSVFSQSCTCQPKRENDEMLMPCPCGNTHHDNMPSKCHGSTCNQSAQNAAEPTHLKGCCLWATPNGIALCCDATLVSPLTRTGQPQPCSADVDGAALRVAERRKRATYPEFAFRAPPAPARRQVWLGTQVAVGGLAACPSRSPCCLFARQFYGSRSLYTWLDADGCEHDIAQGEGGEQGDPLMPALYSLAVHPALEASAAHLRDGEAIFAFLDDTYVVAPPERVAAVHATLQEALWSHARIRLNAGKKPFGTPLVRNLLTSLTSKCPAGTQSGLAPGPCPLPARYPSPRCLAWKRGLRPA